MVAVRFWHAVNSFLCGQISTEPGLQKLIYDDEGSPDAIVNHQVDVTSCVVTHGDFRVEYYACQLQLGRPIEQKFF